MCTRHTATTSGGPALQYDDNGNLTQAGIWTYGYDDLSRLMSSEKVEGGVTTTVDYVYGADDERIHKTVTIGGSSITYDYVYDLNNNVIAEYDQTNNNTVLRRYVYGPWIDEPLAMYDYTGGGTDVKFYHADHVGTIIAMSDDDVDVSDPDMDGQPDPSGDLTDVYSYSSFGEVGLEGVEGNPYRYTGRRLDAETGLYYYRARYYSAELGRFLQADPIGYGDGPNMYAYVGNDPINFRDPFGLENCAGAVTQADCFTLPENGVGRTGATTYFFAGGTALAARFTPIGIGLAAADGPFPVGDTVALVGFGTAFVIGGGYAIINSSDGDENEQNVSDGLGESASLPPDDPNDPNNFDPETDAQTGRGPQTEEEYQAIREAKANPTKGRILDIKLGDPRWKASEGWVKMQSKGPGTIRVHYNYNTVTGRVADAKIVRS